jgi:hypothetical protein
VWWWSSALFPGELLLETPDPDAGLLEALQRLHRPLFLVRDLLSLRPWDYSSGMKASEAQGSSQAGKQG